MDGGELAGRVCLNCGLISYPARGICPKCGGLSQGWYTLSGRGTLLFASAGDNVFYSRAYIAATVELEEGILIGGELIAPDLDLTDPGAILGLNGENIPVRMYIKKDDFGTHAVFEPQKRHDQ